MLTEPWPWDHDPTLPQRWEYRTSPAPVTVYLDQWCYDHLARDRAGRTLNANEKGSFDYFRKLAISGKVIFLLSQTHYQENWARNNEDARWDTTVAMAELSGFNTITSVGLDYWDAVEGVAAYMGANVSVGKPRVFGWGWSHALLGREATASIIDERTGRPAAWDKLPQWQRAQIGELENRVVERFEFSVLARRDPRLEPGMAPFPEVPDDGKGALLLEEEHHVRAVINQAGRDESAVRAIVEARSFADMVTQSNVRKASVGLGLGPDSIVDEISGHSTSGGYRRALSTFLVGMPIQGRYSELRVQAHMRESRALKNSDGRDYYSIAAISPFVDYLVTDKSMYFLAEAAGLSRRSGAIVLRSLADLRQRLESDLGYGS